MKSVLKTFSQSAGNMLAKSCLAVLCVFVFSSMGNAQSFMEATEAQQILRPILVNLNQFEMDRVPDAQVKVETDNGTIVVDNTVSFPTNQEDAAFLDLRRIYYTSLSSYIDWVDYDNVVSNAIERNHQFMLQKTSGQDQLLEELKLEVTNLLTN